MAKWTLAFEDTEDGRVKMTVVPPEGSPSKEITHAGMAAIGTAFISKNVSVPLTNCAFEGAMAEMSAAMSEQGEIDDVGPPIPEELRQQS